MAHLNANSGKIIAYGKYHLTGNTLGQGSFAKIKEAIDQTRPQRGKVALKIMEMNSRTTSYNKMSCSREACILAKLDHPNVIKMLDCFQTTRQYVIVLEIMPINLCEYIEDPKMGPMREARCRIIIRQVANAISYLHSMKVVHRDVKLENVLLDPRTNRAKLTDFGLSAEWDGESGLKTHCGSPEYCAPELHAGLNYSSAVDIWALGVVLYAMTVGRLPFDIETLHKGPVSDMQRKTYYLMAMKHGIETDYHQRYMKALSRPLKDLLSKMISPNQQNRWKIDQILKHGWISLQPPAMVASKKTITASTSSSSSSNAKSKIPTLRPQTAMVGEHSGERKFNRPKSHEKLKYQLAATKKYGRD